MNILYVEQRLLATDFSLRGNLAILLGHFAYAASLLGLHS
jgi:hypothetical protein